MTQGSAVEKPAALNGQYDLAPRPQRTPPILAFDRMPTYGLRASLSCCAGRKSHGRATAGPGIGLIGFPVAGSERVALLLSARPATARQSGPLSVVLRSRPRINRESCDPRHLSNKRKMHSGGASARVATPRPRGRSALRLGSLGACPDHNS